MNIQLNKIAEIKMGHSFRSRMEIDQSGELSVIQMKDLHGDQVNCNGLAKIEFGEPKKEHLVQKGDIVFRARGQDYSSALISDDPGLAVIAAPLYRIRVKDPMQVSPKYLLWQINQPEILAIFKTWASGSLVKMVNREVLDNLEITLAPLICQQQVVNLAQLARREKELMNRLIHKRGQYISAILKQALKGYDQRDPESS